MKIGIIYLGIGSYINFWEEFYKSSELYFLKKYTKKYFLFTNSKVVNLNKNVEIVYQDDLGWPGNTLNRYHMILNIKEQLKEYDYLYFFNSNYIFLDKIEESEFIPNQSEDYLINLIWSKVNNNSKDKFPYERNPKSQSFISFDKGRYYYQGGMTGGKTEEFLKLVESCREMINIDKLKNIVPLNNDESYLNRYLLDYNPKVIDERYGMPEEWGSSSDAKMILRDKNKILGIENIKKQKKEIYGFLNKLKNKILKKYYKVRYYK